MKIAFCIALKNRSCVIVEKEDSLKYCSHVTDKIVPYLHYTTPMIVTKDDRIGLLLFPNFLRSLVKHKQPSDDWVIVVTDYNSTDVVVKDMLEYELDGKIPYHLETVKDYPHFDRGGGLATAAQIADKSYHADILFFCDADLMFQRREVIDRAVEVSRQGRFYYPIFFAFVNPEHTHGFYRDTSFGNFACSTEDYKKTEGWYHNISWGWEDRALADSIPSQLKERECVEGFLHQWHPMEWEFRVKEYPVKEYLFKDAACKELPQ